MQLSMQTKFVQKYTATSQESNDRVTPLFKRLVSVWYTVAIRLCCADCEVSKGVRTVWVPPHPEVMSASYVAYVPNHMKYTSQGSGNSYIPAGFVTFS